MDNPRKTLLVVRFLGTTPTSSSIPTMLLSICQQICYNMEVRTTTRILPIQKKTLDSTRQNGLGQLFYATSFFRDSCPELEKNLLDSNVRQLNQAFPYACIFLYRFCIPKYVVVYTYTQQSTTKCTQLQRREKIQKKGRNRPRMCTCTHILMETRMKKTKFPKCWISFLR